MLDGGSFWTPFSAAYGDVNLQAPWVLFSERVMGMPNKKIVFQEDGGQRYTIHADSTCSAAVSASPSTPCVEIARNKASFYPLGKLDSFAKPWTSPGKTYCDLLNVGSAKSLERTNGFLNGSQKLRKLPLRMIPTLF